MNRIVYCVDRGYAIPLAVSLRSLHESNPGKQISVIVLTLDFDDELVARVRRSVPELEVSFVDVESVIPSGLPRVKAFSRAAYGRLFAPAVLAGSAERILYLDADTIVLGNLDGLNGVILADHTLAAVQSVEPPFISGALGVPMWRSLGISRDAPYFNSGVLLINPERWIEQRVAERTIEMAQTYSDSNLWADQDALNIVFQGDFLRLDQRWNAESPLRKPIHLGHALFDPDEIRSAGEDPAVVHFIGSPKPWQRGCTDTAAPQWWDFLRRTDWADLAPLRRLSVYRELRYRVGLALRG